MKVKWNFKFFNFKEILGQHKLDLLKDSDRLMKHGMIAVVIKKVGNLLNKKQMWNF